MVDAAAKLDAKRRVEKYLDTLPADQRREVKKALRELLYAKDPVTWAREILEIELDPWQAELNRTPVGAQRNRCLALSHRQGGKTLAMSVALSHQAKYGPPGTDSIVLAPTARQSSEVIRRTKQLLHKAKADFLVENTYSFEVVTDGLPTRATGYPGSDPSSIRGASVSGILAIDEAAFFPNRDETILTALPFLLRHKKTARLLAATTPGISKTGWFYSQWTATDNDADYIKVSAHIEDCRHLSEADLERERRSMPHSTYLREYCLQWGGEDFRLVSDQGLQNMFNMSALHDPTADEVDPDQVVVNSRPAFGSTGVRI